MSEQQSRAAPRPGQTVITVSDAHVGTVVETRPPLFAVVTLRGTFWFGHEVIQEIEGEVVRLRCEFVDLEREARPEPEQSNGNGGR